MCEAERWAAELVAKENNAFNETLERIANCALLKVEIITGKNSASYSYKY